jgi:hypothetical protein
VGKVKKKQKRKRVGGGEKIKFPPKKKRSEGKKNWEGNREKRKLQKKPEIRADKAISALSIHVGALVGAGSLWPLRW